MNIMWVERIFILLGMCFLTHSYALTASVDRKKLTEGETFTLTVATEKTTQDALDFKILSKAFHVFGTSRSTQLNSVNGVTQARTQWVISLYPKHAGKLTIPSLQLGEEHTEAINITVLPASHKGDVAAQNESVFFDISVTPKTPYVGSQVIYDLKLYYDVAMHNENLLPPTLGDIPLERLGQAQTYVAHLDGKPFQVFEQRFVFFPKMIGQMTLSGPVFSAMVVETTETPTGLGDFMIQQMGKPLRIVGESVSLKVAALPDNKEASSLVASDLRISEKWSAPIEKAVVGEPYTRTIVIKATGVKAAQLPVLSEQTTQAGLKVYPDKAQLGNTLDEKGIEATRIEKIAYIPTAPGEFILPEINVTWWDTKTARYQRAHLGARQIHVEGSTPVSSAAAAPLPGPIIQPLRTAPVRDGLYPQSQARWPFVALALSLTVILCLVLLLYRQSRHRLGITESSKHAKKRFHNACQAHNPKEASQALLQWAQQVIPQKRLLSIADIAEHLPDDPAVKTVLSALQAVLYQKDGTDWDGMHCFDVISSAFLMRQKTLREKVKRPPLPPLNPPEE